MEEEKDLRVQVGVLMCRSLARCRGARLLVALRERSRILKIDTICDQEPVKRPNDRGDVINGGGSGDDAGGRVLDQMKFMDLKRRPKRRELL